MTEHKPIQDPEKFSEMNYKYFEAKLFSEDTSKEELEEICMTLGHLPTKEAQDLLQKFKNSKRAKDVEWLDCAIEEGKYLYLSSTNEQEERDLLALKLLHNKDDEIVELMGKRDEHDYAIRKMKIELEALDELLKEDPDIEIEILAMQSVMQFETGKLEEVEKNMELQEKIREKIKQSITTERYKNVDPMYMANIHFDGEVW